MPTAPTSWASRTPGSIACARAFASSTACCSAALFALVGVVMGGLIVATWIAHGFGSLADERLAVIAASLLIVGIQIFFSSFLLSILGLRRR